MGDDCFPLAFGAELAELPGGRKFPAWVAPFVTCGGRAVGKKKGADPKADP